MYRRQIIPFKAGSHFVYDIPGRDAIKHIPGVIVFVQGVGQYISNGLAWYLTEASADTTYFRYSDKNFTGASLTDITYDGPDVGFYTAQQVNNIMLVFVGGVLQTYVIGAPGIDEYTYDHVTQTWTFPDTITNLSLHIVAKIMP